MPIDSLHHVLPEKDPRKRGTIEAFFRFFRRLCRYFAGQAFSNVVEKGDYDGQKMASLTFDEIYRLAVRFIVDVYHHRPHRGLERRTPFAVWNERQKRGLRPTLGTEEIIYGFGIRTEATIAKHGVIHEGIAYQGTYGPDTGGKNLIESLHRILPAATKVDVFVDPFDLGTILVRVPRDIRNDAEFGGRNFVLAESVEKSVRGRTLEELLAANKEVLAFVKAEEAEGRPIRIRAQRDLADYAEAARLRAGHPEFSLTQEAHDRLVAAIGHMGRAGIEGVRYGDAPVDDEEPLGTLVAEPQRTSPPEANWRNDDRDDDGQEPPFGGSINDFDEEDDR